MEQKAMKAYKATVTRGTHTDEVTVYAPSLEEALEKAEKRFGTVTRVRPVVAPDVSRFAVTQ